MYDPNMSLGDYDKMLRGALSELDRIQGQISGAVSKWVQEHPEGSELEPLVRDGDIQIEERSRLLRNGFTRAATERFADTRADVSYELMKQASRERFWAEATPEQVGRAVELAGRLQEFSSWATRAAELMQNEVWARYSVTTERFANNREGLVAALSAASSSGSSSDAVRPSAAAIEARAQAATSFAVPLSGGLSAAPRQEGIQRPSALAADQSRGFELNK